MSYPEIINVGWFILSIIQIAISISFFYKYKVDKDKQKLMFGLAFFVIVYSHIYEAFPLFFTTSNLSLIFENIQYWTFFPLVFAIGFAIHQRFLKTVDFDKIFNVFLFFSLLSFPLIIFNPVPAKEYAALIAIFIGIEIESISLINTMKNKDAFNVLILLANLCFILGGASLSMGYDPNSIFSFFIGGLLVLFMFFLSDRSHTMVDSSISNFFTIQNELTETKNELQSSTEKYKQLTETLPEGVLIINKLGIIKYANPELEKIYDVPFSESKGTSFTKYMAKSSLLKSLHLLKKIKKGKRVEKVELDALHHDGHVFPVEIWATPLETNGYIDDILCVLRDITERKQAQRALKESEAKLRKSERELKEAQKIAKMGRWDYLHAENRLKWTETIYDIFEISPDNFKVTFDGFLSKVHPDDRESVNHAWNQSLKNKEPYTIEHRLLVGNNQIKWVKEECETTFDRHGKPIHSIGIVQDITERKKAEEKLKDAHDRLKDLNQNLERRVEERTREVQRLLKQKDEFINQLGHDLKNPLGPFIQLLPILKKHVRNTKDEKIVTVLDRNANYMQNLVRKTIDLAKLNSENTKFTFEKVSLFEILDDVIAVNTSLFDTHEMTVENNVNSDYLVLVDTLHVQELFTNLFNNAVKYTEGTGKIAIDAKPVDDHVLISVKDNGIGVSSDQMDHLFDEYYKADTSRHDFDSSGLGLPICKRIIEKHGGRIWAESDGIGEGTTFYFTLPMKQISYEQVTDEVDKLLVKN